MDFKEIRYEGGRWMKVDQSRVYCLVYYQCCFVGPTTVPCYWLWDCDILLDPFAILRRATISFVLSVRPSVHMEQLSSHWTYFHEIWYYSTCRNSVCLSTWNNSVPTGLIFMKFDTTVMCRNSLDKSQDDYTLARTAVTLHEDVSTFITISWSVLLRMRNVSDRSCREKQNTHFMFNNLFFSKIVPFMRSCGKIL